jgi:hypothetical protein
MTPGPDTDEHQPLPHGNSGEGTASILPHLASPDQQQQQQAQPAKREPPAAQDEPDDPPAA